MAGFRKLARDTALLTASSLVMSCIGLVWQLWLVRRIGAAGIGLWQLVGSVSALAATLAISGIRFTTTRLVSEEIGAAAPDSAGRAVRRCLVYALLCGCAAAALLRALAEPVGFLWIGDARTVLSLRIIALTLPLLSLSCVLNGWFVASGRAWVSAAVQVAEQLFGIGCIMFLLRNVRGGDLEQCCAAISRGNLLADAASLLLVSLLYLADRPRRRGGGRGERLTGRMLRIAVPLAFSAYARVSLTTAEHLLVPRKLREAGYSAQGALAGYGTVSGMVFPIIGFPSCLLTAVAELTVPELTAAQVQGDDARIGRTVSVLLRAALAFSLAVALFLFLTADALGRMLYRTETVGPYLRLFALLIPPMYLDIVTDGCLKGLGQMLWSMGLNVVESAVGVLLVVALLPRYALNGYIAVIFFCELINFAASFGRLKKTVDFRLLPRGVLSRKT